MTTCTFCKIVQNQISSYKIYETSDVLVFLDNAQDVDYHLIVIPKKHVENLLDCDEETLAKVMNAAKRVAKHCVDHLCFDGVNLLSAANPAAGQSVQHFHLHLILRKNQDQVDAWPQFPGSQMDLAETHAYLNLLEK